MAENSDQQPMRHGRGRPFVAGQSGNPGGRPAVVKDIQELARLHTPECVNALLAALDRPGERVRTAEVLLAYAYGRPTQQVNVGGGLTLEQLVLGAMAREGSTIESEAKAVDEENDGGLSLSALGYRSEH